MPFLAGLPRLAARAVKAAFDLTGDFCTSGSEREFPLEGRW